jgi:hypothetical protein
MFRTRTALAAILAMLALTGLSANLRSAPNIQQNSAPQQSTVTTGANSTNPHTDSKSQADPIHLDPALMKAILRVVTPDENRFFDFVLWKMNTKVLPPEMFYSTFEWARKKPSKNRFQYFKQALIVRAAAIGIDLSGDQPPPPPNH